MNNFYHFFKFHFDKKKLQKLFFSLFLHTHADKYFTRERNICNYILYI